jgi:hypothetical protein
MKAAGRAIAAAVLAGLFGAAWVALFYAWHPAIVVEFDRDLPRNVSGVHPPERDRASGLTFAWTSSDALIRLPGLDRRVPWTLDVRVRGARPSPPDNPYLMIVVDGANVEQTQTTPDFSDVRVTIPARPDRRGVLIDLKSSDTFVPGASDPRPLGVMLDRFVLSPQGVVLVPDAALEATALSSGAMGAAIALVGVTAGSAIGGAVLLSAGIAAVMARGFGPFSAYPSTVVHLSRWIAFALAALALLTEYLRGRPLRNTARFAAIFSASALLLKLAVLLHPNMPVGDAMFHAHRFESVLAGRYYFTSIAPGGYSFPYPPGLYVFASAFASLVHRGIPDMALLRIVTTAIDCAFGLLLYWVVVRNWGNRLAGAMAVAIYHLMPLNFGVLTTGNLTNAFAQSVAIGALALMAAPALSTATAPLTLLLTAVLAVAFMSHTGTVAILSVASACTSVLFFVRGGLALRRAAWAIAISTAIAAAVSLVVYYGWFIDTYRTELARIGHETAAAAPDVGGRTIGDRLRLVPYELRIYIGAPVLLFAFLRAVELARRRASDLSTVASAKVDRLALTLAGWTVSCLAFLVLGILTPIDMRYYLAALPVVAIAAGSGGAWAWDDGWRLHRRLWRLVAAVFLADTISTGFHHWWSVLG